MAVMSPERARGEVRRLAAAWAYAAYGLSERERRVTGLVARGLPTGDIADRPRLSPWTVQDHLKAIFAKTGTRTRGELVARLDVEHT